MQGFAITPLVVSNLPAHLYHPFWTVANCSLDLGGRRQRLMLQLYFIHIPFRISLHGLVNTRKTKEKMFNLVLEEWTQRTDLLIRGTKNIINLTWQEFHKRELHYIHPLASTVQIALKIKEDETVQMKLVKTSNVQFTEDISYCHTVGHMKTLGRIWHLPDTSCHKQ